MTTLSNLRAAAKVLVIAALLSIVLSARPNAVASSSPASQSEGDLFSDAQPSKSTLKSLDAARDPTIVRTRYVNVNFDRLTLAELPPNAHLGAGVSASLSLNLFEDASFKAVLDDVQLISPAAFSWVGHLDGVAFSQVVLVVDQDSRIVSGNITMPGAFYQVRYAAQGVHAIYQIDQSAFPPDDAPTPKGGRQVGSAQSGSKPAAANADSGAVIDVMAVYDAAASSAAGGTTAMNTLVDLAVTETNQSYLNSGITQRIRLVYKGQVNYDETGFSWDATINHLQNPSDGVLDDVPTLRNTYGADAVVFIAETDGSYCGLAYNILDPVSHDFENQAYALVGRSCATGYYSFGHELGHLMGARHDWAADPTDGSPYAYNHGYVYTGSNPYWRTVMAYNDNIACGFGGCTRLQYWSNPDINYNNGATNAAMGVPANTYHAADNRKTLNNTAPIVANFRASVSSSPGAATLISPADGAALTTPSPTLSWTAADAATWYYLWVGDPSGSPQAFGQWYQGSSVCSGGTCTVTPATTLPNGSYKWFVQTWNVGGSGPWSDGMSFSIGTPTPPSAKAAQSAPSGNVTTLAITYQWGAASADTNAVAGQSAADAATWYYLWVGSSGTQALGQWYQSSSICTGGTCRVTLSAALMNGHYTWYVETWNSGGFGPWSDGMSFDLAVSALDKVTLSSPSGKIDTSQPTYAWTGGTSDAATWYYLRVIGPNGQVIGQWYQATSICTGGTCQVTPSVTLVTGDFHWSILGWNPAGLGPWSDEIYFSTPAAPTPPSLAATQIAPSGNITTLPIAYQWDVVTADTNAAADQYAADAATWYYVWVGNSGGQEFGQWYQGSSICRGSACQVTPSWDLPAGTHSWYIQSWNAGGYGPWSDGMSFTAPSPLPGKATLLSPSGASTESQPTYQWNPVLTDVRGAALQADAAATWYELWVGDSSSNTVFEQWYEGSSVCSSTVCSVTPSLVLFPGDYMWYILTWNSAGLGPWSAGMGFSVVSLPGGFDSEFNDSMDPWVQNSGTWSIESGAYLTSTGVPEKYASVSYPTDYLKSTNFAYQVLVRRDGCQKCDSYINIRGTPGPLDSLQEWNSAYEFSISRDGYFSVWKGVGGTWEALQTYTYTSAIMQGSEWNTLRVVAQGSQMYFYINLTLVWSGSDSDLSSGRVGVDWYSDGSSTDKLSVDRATLSIFADQAASAIAPTVGAEQQALNDAANQAAAGQDAVKSGQRPQAAPTPNDTAVPQDTPTANDTAVPQAAPTPNDTAVPQDTPTANDTPVPQATPTPNDTAVPQATPTANDTPVPQDTPTP